MMEMIMEQARFQEQPRLKKDIALLKLILELFGIILARTFEEAVKPFNEGGLQSSRRRASELTGLFETTLENPLRFSPHPAGLKFILEYLKPPVSKILHEIYADCGSKANQC